MMKNWVGCVLVGAVGVVGVGGCGSDEASDATAPPVSAKPVAAGATLFEDSFVDDRNGWGVVDDEDYGTIAFADGDYVWAARGSLVHWLPGVIGEQYDRGELDMLDVVVQAEVTVVAGGGVVGVFCREVPDTDAEWQWYEFVVRDGYAAIRKADLEGNLESLAETTSAAAPLGQPVEIEAACTDRPDGTAALSLAVDGTTVLSVEDDDPLGNGAAGLQLWTFPAHEQMDVRWHDFQVSAAEL